MIQTPARTIVWNYEQDYPVPPYSAQRPPDVPGENPWIALTYQQYVNGLEGETRQWCLRWVQVCRFAPALPQGCECFEGRFASLGIDRLGLSNEKAQELLEAVARSGVRLPDTAWKLHVARPWCAFVETIQGDEPVLPTHWLEGLELHGKPDSLWIGRRVQEQPLCPAPVDELDEASLGASKRTEEIDWSAHQAHRYGWKRRGVSSWPTSWRRIRDEP